MIGGYGRWTRLGVAERPVSWTELAVEVERVGLRPQAPDDRARLGEAADRVGEVVERQTVRLVLAPGERMARSRARADPEVEPPAGHDVDGRCDLGQHRRWPEAVARHQQPDAQALGLRGEGGEQRPTLERRAAGVAADRHEVVEQPRVLDLRNRVRLPPHPEYVAVSDLHRRRHDPETRLRHLDPLAEQCSAALYGAAFRFTMTSSDTTRSAPMPGATSRPCSTPPRRVRRLRRGRAGARDRGRGRRRDGHDLPPLPDASRPRHRRLPPPGRGLRRGRPGPAGEQRHAARGAAAMDRSVRRLPGDEARSRRGAAVGQGPLRDAARLLPRPARAGVRVAPRAAAVRDVEALELLRGVGNLCAGADGATTRGGWSGCCSTGCSAARRRTSTAAG